MEYPEHEKLKARKEEHQAICEFLSFLEENGHSIIHYEPGCVDDEYNRPIEIRSNLQDLIADFFEINQQKFAEEKDQMIKRLVKLGTDTPPGTYVSVFPPKPV
jgi:benzoyl-CoA reductase/2-hydroxyglutaryl-CoA dehydratase subunit BcrC/BadD/HgdB